jgi:endonuclease/exonuclease/phosphatase family metal-dependent hydrolase
MKRITLVPLAGLAFATLLLLDAATASAQTRLRLVAANITSGNSQSYEAPATRIFDGLNPDIVMLQEFNVGDNSTTTIQNWVTSTFGTGYTYFREAGGQSIPNGVISRYPIIATGEIDDTYVADRDHAWARIDIPGSVDLYAISVHLKASSGYATTRNSQATVIKNWINANVPAGSYVAVGGDYNTQSNTEACLTTLGSVVVSTSPYPADQAGNVNTNASRAKPYDRCLVNTALNAVKTPVLIGSNSHTNGLVFDSRVYTPLSAVSPVLSTDSGATNMQHMAIVKDFMVGSGSASPTPTATPSPTPSPTASPTASATPSATPTPTPSPTPTATPTPSPSPTSGGGTNLIISEYVEGSSNNKALEIYNPTASAISLSGYTVKVFFNGATSSTTTITLSGTIAAGACHVTAYSGSGSTLLAKANSTFTGSPWNGDDAIVLYQGTTVRDSIGRVGQDPGTAWGTTVTTVDSTLRRNASVVAGDTNTGDAFDPATQYTNAGLDVFTGLGVR